MSFRNFRLSTPELDQLRFIGAPPGIPPLKLVGEPRRWRRRCGAHPRARAVIRQGRCHWVLSSEGSEIIAVWSQSTSQFLSNSRSDGSPRSQVREMIDSGPALEAVQVAAAATDARGRRVPRPPLCPVRCAPAEFPGQLPESLAGAPRPEISADSTVSATRPPGRQSGMGLAMRMREHARAQQKSRQGDAMARARAVIASHTTVGAAARRRPIARACLLGLLVSWWFWPQGPHGPRPRPTWWEPH